MKSIIVVCVAVVVFFAMLVFAARPVSIQTYPNPEVRFWQYASIDTMKISRDLAQQKKSDSAFDTVIDTNVAAIAQTGATHVAIATPYDEEFIPLLRRWVAAARKNNLSVWFRGNWSGWEGWFGYSKISRTDHIKKTGDFIQAHADLFSDGDIFSACPECENGGPGDPRTIHDVNGHRTFLIKEYDTAERAFETINKKVDVRSFSMNADIARLVMDSATTKKMGGVITIDHYVKEPWSLNNDVEEFSKLGRGMVLLGEFGAPIPDINGSFTEAEQAAWIRQALDVLAKNPALEGLNYWTDHGGSTNLWEKDGRPRSAVKIITQYYKPRTFYGVVANELRQPIPNVRVKTPYTTLMTDRNGYFAMPVLADQETEILFYVPGYKPRTMNIRNPEAQTNIVMERSSVSFSFSFRALLQKFLFQ